MRDARRKSRRTAVAVILTCLLPACTTDAARSEADLSGTWDSEPVVLDRGDFQEEYFFTLDIGAGSEAGILNLTYAASNDPATVRTVRQDLAVIASAGEIQLAGSNPRLVAGPEIVGIYEPDAFFCDARPTGDVDTLACNWGSDAHGEPPRVQLTRRDADSAATLPVDTLITTVSGVLGEATDLAVGADGILLVLDRLNGQVHRVDGDTGYAGTFAGEGAGPTELSRPSALAAGRGDTLWVADAGNGRLQAYSMSGEHLASGRAHGWIALPSHVTREGFLIASASGQDSALAVLFDREGERSRAYGAAPAPLASGVELRMAALAEMIADGEVPPVFRNTAYPFATASGDVWLSRPVDGVLERYGAESDTAAAADHAMPAIRIQLAEPELTEIRERWLEENRDPESDGVSVLLYVSDIYATDDYAWVLLNQPFGDPAVLLRFARSGERLGRWTLPQASGATRLAVDPVRGRLYFGIGELAQVIALSAPGGSP